MPNKQLKTAFQFILGGMIMMLVAVGCSDSSTTKETTTDSTKDTMKMDTAQTKPIVNPPN